MRRHGGRQAQLRLQWCRRRGAKCVCTRVSVCARARDRWSVRRIQLRCGGGREVVFALKVGVTSSESRGGAAVPAVVVRRLLLLLVQVRG